MHERFGRGGFDLRMIRLPTWKLWLLMAIGGAVALALVVAAAGLFLILLPVVLIGGFVARLLLSGSRPAARPRPGGPPAVIEGHYEVVEVREERTTQH